VKILGAIELWDARFHYRQDSVFNATTYFAFVEQLARRYRRRGAIPIQDNASYHSAGLYLLQPGGTATLRAPSAAPARTRGGRSIGVAGRSSR
jgi:hypothetical protein